MVDSKSSSYKSVMVTSSVLLLVFIVVGAIWELAKKLKTRRMVFIEGKSVKETSVRIVRTNQVNLERPSSTSSLILILTFRCVNSHTRPDIAFARSSL